jgi:hypothetical protein
MLLVHVGTLPATKTTLAELIVIVSENSFVPPVVIMAPVPVTKAVTGVNMNVRDVGTRPPMSWFEMTTDANDDAVAARVV